MLCNKEIVSEFTPEQIVECEKCIYLSKEKKWCGWFGINIRKPQQTGRFRKEEEYKEEILTLDIMVSSYKIVADGLKKNNRKVINQNEYLKRRTMCIECNGGYKCPHICCGLEAKLAVPDFKCKKGKW